MWQMYEGKDIALTQIADLRMIKGTSARSMSLSLGQNFTYINSIENKKNLPSMEMFFHICDYLDVSPQEFFDENNKDPECLTEVISNLKKLDAHSLASISCVIEILAQKRNR